MTTLAAWLIAIAQPITDQWGAEATSLEQHVAALVAQYLHPDPSSSRAFSSCDLLSQSGSKECRRRTQGRGKPSIGRGTLRRNSQPEAENVDQNEDDTREEDQRYLWGLRVLLPSILTRSRECRPNEYCTREEDTSVPVVLLIRSRE